MQIEIVSDNAFARKLNVVVPADTVASALERALREFGARAKVPGFRPGKVPRQVVEARFGPSLANDVAEDLIQKAWTSALVEHGLEPVSRPSLVDRGEIKRGAVFTFTIGVEVRPEATVGTYTGLEVTWPSFAVTDDEVDANIEQQRKMQSRLVEVTDRAVKPGDTVQVEVKAHDGDTVVLDEPGTLVRTSGDAWLPGLGNLLIGAALGDTRTGTIEFSSEARNEAVAGRTLSVTAKVLGIQALEAPTIEAFAADQGHADVAALRAAVRAELEAGGEENAKHQARANLLQALVDANRFDVPAGMIEQNLQMLLEEVKLQQAYRGVDPKNVRFTQAQIDDLRVRAAFAAQGGLLLEAVAKAESLEITDADVEARIAAIAAERNQSADTVRSWFERDGGLAELKDRLLEEKTIDWMLDRAKITREAPPSAEPTAEAPKKKAPAKKKAEAEAPAAEPEPAAEAPKKKAPAKKKTEG